MDEETKDSNGTVLQEGDSVQLIRDLKVKGSSSGLKRGDVVKNIHLTYNPEQIDCRTKKIKNLVLKTCYVKKV